jgi:iron-sulfur cluster repair protein YtfE (RIC family)
LLKVEVMNATDLLEKQHRRAEAAFKKILSEKGDPTPVLHQLADELVAHMVIEEKLFYPAIRTVDEDLVFESFEEHAIASLALVRALEIDHDDPRFLARVTVLSELIEHHVEEEEEELFPKVNKKLDEQALRDLGKEMQALFDEQVAAGHEAVLAKRAPKSPTDKAATKEAGKDEAAIERAELPPKSGKQGKAGKKVA